MQPETQSAIRVFADKGVSYAHLIDILKWLDQAMTDPLCGSKHAFAWIQQQLHSVELTPDQKAIRTVLLPDGLYVSLDDVKGWVRQNQGSAREMAAIRLTWEMLDALDERPSPFGFDATMPHQQIFNELFNEKTVQICDKWKVAVNSHDTDRLSVDYIMGSSLPVSIGVQRNTEGHLMDAIKGAVGRLRFEPTSPHHRQAVTELETDKVLEVPSRDPHAG